MENKTLLDRKVALPKLIGDTDNAVVYKGFQPSMNRHVAVKVLKPKAFNAILAKAAGSPAEHQIHQVVIRSQ
jgi:serine/threonine protein kinase